MITLELDSEMIDDDATDTSPFPVTALMIATSDNERMVHAYVAALSRDRDAVEDLSQEVFLRALSRIDRVKDPADIGRFLRGMARHVVQEHFRSRRRSRRYLELTAAALIERGETPAELCHNRAMLEMLGAAIEQLPLVSRRMLEMRYTESRDAADIGRALGITDTAVRVSLLRIRERLRKRLAGDARPNSE